MSELNTDLLLQEAAGLKSIASGYECDRARLMLTPSHRLLPKLFIDGNKWCALFGANIQDGVAGFGDSPDEAYKDFDLTWTNKLRIS